MTEAREHTWEARHEARSAAEPSAVWARWADPARWSEWNTGVTAARLEGPFLSGTTALIWFRGGLRLRFLITEVVPERLFTDEARLPFAWVGHEHRVDPHAGGGARLRHRIYFRGPLASLYGLLVGRRARVGLAESVERLARQSTDNAPARLPEAA
jgi:hypothetical protein